MGLFGNFLGSPTGGSPFHGGSTPFGGRDFISPVETEKKRETQEYISDAKRYVSEGEEIYETAYRNVSSYASETEEKLRRHNEYKQQIAKNLGATESILKNFRQFDIDAKVINAPKISAGVGGMDVSVFQSRMSSCMPQIETFSVFDLFSEYDHYKAKKQRDEARQYRARMKRESEKLYQYKEQMSEIQSFIGSERKELDSLMKKVNKMTDELNCGMKKKKFSKEEADYLKAIHKITEQIVELLSTQFLTDSFSITSKYQQVYDQVRTINHELPNAPSIKDRTTLDAIRVIVDGPVVY